MTIVTFLIIAALFHCSLFFFDTIFRSCSHYPYFLLMENAGLEIKLFSVKWYTMAFNRKFLKWALNKSRFLRIWFDVGVFVSIALLLPVAMFVIVKMTLGMLSSQQEAQNSETKWVLEPVIPGVNVPFTDIKYHVITLGLCSIIHEFGHALAACREDIQLYGVGLVFAYIVPIAFVSVNSDQLNQLSVRNQLRILCAGVWHNIVLASIAALLFFAKSSVWILLFNTNSGVYVKNINANSPLLGAQGLLNDDVIYKINDCPINSVNDWYYCILQSIKQPTPGYCVTQSTIEEYNESIPAQILPNGVVNCCNSASESRGSICFEDTEKALPNSPQTSSHLCLSARAIIERSSHQCQSTSHCPMPNLHCLKPSAVNTTKMMQIMRKDGKDVIFFGYPVDVYNTIEVSDWIPKYGFLSTDLPESMELLCKYIAMLSAGLAIINIIPCFFFDGQHIVVSVMENFLRPIIRSKRTRGIITLTVTGAGTLLVVLNVLHAIIKM